MDLLVRRVPRMTLNHNGKISCKFINMLNGSWYTQFCNIHLVLCYQATYSRYSGLPPLSFLFRLRRYSWATCQNLQASFRSWCPLYLSEFCFNINYALLAGTEMSHSGFKVLALHHVLVMLLVLPHIISYWSLKCSWLSRAYWVFSSEICHQGWTDWTCHQRTLIRI